MISMARGLSLWFPNTLPGIKWCAKWDELDGVDGAISDRFACAPASTFADRCLTSVRTSLDVSEQLLPTFHCQSGRILNLSGSSPSL
jgi:hypothetical protein